MISFLQQKLDIVLFLFSALFLLICKISFINSKASKKNDFWLYITIFFLISSIRFLLTAVSLSFYRNDILLKIILIMSPLVLMDYANSHTKPLYNSRYWKWNIWILGVLTIALTFIVNTEIFLFLLKYLFCLGGGIWTGIVILREARLHNHDRRLLKLQHIIGLLIIALFFVRFIGIGHNLLDVWGYNYSRTLYSASNILVIILILITTNLYLNRSFILTGIKRLNFLRYLTIFLILFFTWFITERFGNNENKNLETHLLSRAETAAASINPARVESLTFSTNDEKKEDYKRLREQLYEIRKVNNDIRFIYIVGAKNNDILFALDSEDKNSPDYSAPGDVYKDAPEAISEAYKKGDGVVNGPYTDKWGIWISSFVPIRDFKTHKILGILGMDINAKNWKEQINGHRVLGIMFGLLLLVFSFVFFVIYEINQITTTAIKKSEEKFSAAFNRSPVMKVISTLEEGRLLEVNDTLCQMLGYTKEELIGKTSIEVGIFKDIESRGMIKKNLMQNGFIENFEMEMKRKDGSILIGLYYGTAITIDGEKCLISVIEDITESKKAQDIIRDNEQYLSTMWNSLQAGIAVIDPDTFKIVDVNPATLRILNLKREDIIGHSCNEYICMNECDNCPVIKQGKNVSNVETFFKDFNGNLIPILKTVELVNLKGKQYLLENFIDITKLSEAQKKLRQSEQRFRDVVMNMADWLWEVDANGVYTYCSEKVYDVLGYTAQELIGKPFTSILSPEKRDEVLKSFQKSISEKESIRDFENKNIRKDGREIIVETSGTVIIDAGGKILGYRGVNKDVTEKKRIEESIRQLSRAVEQSPTCIVIADTNGAIEYVNPKFTILTGYTPEEAKGQNPRILKAGDLPNDHYKELWETITKGSEWRGELHNKKKNGELYWEFASISPIKNPEGVTAHFLAVKEDITYRKKLEAALQESQQDLLRASKVKDEFLSITSHDLKSPLGIVKTSMSLLMEEDNLSPSIKEYANLAMRQANKGLKLIADLLDLKKLETGDVRLETTRFMFSKLANEVIQDFKQSYDAAGVSLLNLSEQDYEISADYNKIGQVISNLLGNAIKYTSSGGTVNISTSLIQKEDSNNSIGDYLKISISDTGSGISSNKLDKIFGKYEQASNKDKKTGTGIGLSIAKFICKLHRGDIWVESELGKGSTFSFILPFNTELREMYNESETMLPYKILIVDDMEDQRFIARSILKKSNFSCDEASNWKEALDKIRTDKISLVLLDVEMPEINGYELLEIIRREKTPAELPVIMYSSKSMDNDLCLKLGVYSFVKKEDAAIVLVDNIKKTLGIA